MDSPKYIMGLFKDEDRAASAVTALAESPFKLLQVHSPIPSHKLAHALKQKKSKLGWFTLTGGIIGLITGFLLAVYCATQWNIIVSGKPVIAIIPFVIVGFEFTILFAVFGNVIGLLTQMDLPNYDGLKRYDPKCSGEHFGVVASCDPDRQEELKAIFTERGGDINVFNNGEDDDKRE